MIDVLFIFSILFLLFGIKFFVIANLFKIITLISGTSVLLLLMIHLVSLL